MNEYSLCLSVCYPEIRAGNGKAVILTDFFYYYESWRGFFAVVFCLFDY